MPGITRRSMLLSLLAGSGLAALGGPQSILKLATAQAQDVTSDHHFIFCYFSGGWDILLGLDPRDPTRFTSENMEETLIQPGYELLPSTLTDGQLIVSPRGIVYGPFIGDLATFSLANRVSVVRGMSMDTLTHEAGRRRFLTGHVPSGVNARGSSAATWLASLFGKEQIIPNLVARTESYNVDQPTYATGLRVDTVSDLLKALRPGDYALSANEEAQINNLLNTFAACDVAQKSTFYQQGEAGRLAANELVSKRVDAMFDFSANTEEMAAIRSHYGIPSGSSGLSTQQARAAMAVVAITSGLSRCVSIELAGGLDSHYGNNWLNEQGPRQQSGFNLMARMAEALAARQYKDTGDSWLDHTTLVAFSEFSRTALLNGYGGRDHALTNAALLLGGKIKGGQVIGASSDTGMSPTATNLYTGLPDPAGEVVKPEHILRTLFAMSGIEDDLADLRVEPIHALLG